MKKKNNTLEEIITAIKKAKNILLTLHLNPDGDSVGSNLAMYLSLKKLRKNPKIYSADKVYPGYLFLPKANQIIYKDPADLNLKNFDLYISLDTSPFGRVSRKIFNLPPNLKSINIDHHITSDFTSHLNLIEPKASSTSELVYTLLKRAGIGLDKNIATCLLTGITTDTAGFRHPNTTPKILRIAADLLAYGVNYEVLIRKLFQSSSFETLKIWGKYLDNLKIDKKYKFIWSKLSYPTLEKIRASQEEISSAYNSLVSGPLIGVRGTKLALLLTEGRPGLVRGNFRTRKDVNSAKIAQALGGGGHKRAAGFDIKGPLKEAERKTLKVVRKYLRSYT